MNPTYKIGIAGCGIGGLAAASALSTKGHRVTIFDRFDAPEPVGSGLVIQPVGLDCLRALQLYDVALARGRPIYQLRGTESRSQRTVLRANYGPVDGERFGLAIHRSDLFDILYRSVCGQSVEIVHSTDITASDLMDDGRILCDSQGHPHGPFDIVIDATGSGSKLSPIKTHALPYGALWGTVQWPEKTPLRRDCLTQCYQGAHHMLGVLPLSNDGRTAIFWSEPQDQISAWYDGDLSRWRDRAAALWPEFAPFAEQITDANQMSAARYRHGTLAKPYAERIAFIGDAAHQASPQLGQGANMALLDAAALMEALSEKPLDKALSEYARTRRLHVRTYQAISRVFTPFYQSESRIYPAIRNNVLHPASQIWPATRVLTSLISGRMVPTGVERRGSAQ